MTNIHTPDEHIAVDDLEAMVDVTLVAARRRAIRARDEERRLGPVVGLGTWNTFDTDAALAGDCARRGARRGHEARRHLADVPRRRAGARRRRSTAAGTASIVATKIWASSLDEGEGAVRPPAGVVRPRRGRAGAQPRLVAGARRVAGGERDAGRDRPARRHALPGLRVRRARRALETGRFQVLQVPYNPWERECEQRLLPLADELGVAVIAMRPLGGSGADARRRIEPSPAELEQLGVQLVGRGAAALGARRPAHRLRHPATSRPERAAENARAGDGAPFSANSARSSSGSRVGLRPHEDRRCQGDQAGRVPRRADAGRRARADQRAATRSTVETGAGVGSAFPDEAYERVGVRIVSVDEVWERSDLVLKVKEPIASGVRAAARRA